MAYNNRHIDPYSHIVKVEPPVYTKQPGSCFHCSSGLHIPHLWGSNAESKPQIHTFGMSFGLLAPEKHVNLHDR